MPSSSPASSLGSDAKGHAHLRRAAADVRRAHPRALEPLADVHARAYALALAHRRQRTGAR